MMFGITLSGSPPPETIFQKGGATGPEVTDEQVLGHILALFEKKEGSYYWKNAP